MTDHYRRDQNCAFEPCNTGCPNAAASMQFGSAHPRYTNRPPTCSGAVGPFPACAALCSAPGNGAASRLDLQCFSLCADKLTR